MRVLILTSAHPKEPVGLNFAEKRFPIGVGMIIQVLRNAGHQVTFIDRYLMGEVDFNDSDYDFVGIYSNTPCFRDTLKIMDSVKTAKIIVGGPHASVFPETLDKADFIVQGEGENAILDIVEGREKNRIVKRPRIDDLDTLPFPPFDILSRMSYLKTVQWFDDAPVFNFNTSRGCPFNCLFCETKRIWGRKYTTMSAGRIIQDIEKCIKDYGVKGIYFREDNFTLDKNRVRQFCELLLQKGIKIKWLCETRVDTIEPNIIKLMAQAGCEVFYIGFESGSQRMLDIYQKGITPEQGIVVADACHKYGIKIAGSFIHDHPEETQQDKQLTEEFINRIKPDTIWQNKWRPWFSPEKGK